jgi:homoserine O-acetyltransferase/O-succinyltransferase
MSDLKIYQTDQDLLLENGSVIKNIEIGYHTYGSFSPGKNNVIWICHAFTANSDAADWWPGMVGRGCVFDPSEHFIVCANFLGSCYGTTGPTSLNPDTGEPYYLDFPEITVRDLVKVHEMLREHLGIHHIHTILGGSVGAHQSMEWAIMNPDLFSNLVIIAAGAYYRPWAIAFNESQRLALQADQTFVNRTPDAGQAGLKAARSMALISYRNHTIYNKTQAEKDTEKTSGFLASSYQQYQGDKLVRRFNAHTYYILTRLADSHNVGRGRGGLKNALGMIKASTLVIGISTDYLFPVEEEKEIAALVPGASYIEIDSLYGHDGFLIEVEKISEIINATWQSGSFVKQKEEGELLGL